MFQRKQQLFDYDFECLNLSNYRLKIIFLAKDSLFLKVLEVAKTKFKVLNKDDLYKLEEFEADPRYNNYIRTSISKQIKNIFKEIEKDKIVVLNNRVEKCLFTKQKNNDWNITIFLTGMYIDKR